MSARRAAAPLRVALGVLAAVTTALLGAHVATGGPAPEHPDAIAAVRWLAGSPAAIAVGLGAAAAFAAFAAGRRVVASGAAGVAAAWALVEAESAQLGGPMHHWMHPSIAVFGWTLGAALARLGGPGEARRSEDALGETGALALVASTYVCAACSKLLHGGSVAADATTLRTLVLAHHAIDDHGALGAYARAVVEAPLAAWALGIATVALQLGAPLLLVGTVPRALAALGLVAFHANVVALLGIGYLPSMATLLALGLPWPRWLLGERPAAAPEPPGTRSQWAAVRTALVVALLAAAVGALLGLQRFPR